MVAFTAALLAIVAIKTQIVAKTSLIPAATAFVSGVGIGIGVGLLNLYDNIIIIRSH